ncbi:Hypothetical predicted protein [Pelobates cultripes]|uniref:Uncharacterized protein n=1 Tax=Pelobates cultripes TaxID=61616 RepID=A0AAD1RF14_PELCU|nr:Hypothetical predicted protein [Pelobates cultripes]
MLDAEAGTWRKLGRKAQWNRIPPKFGEAGGGTSPRWWCFGVKFLQSSFVDVFTSAARFNATGSDAAWQQDVSGRQAMRRKSGACGIIVGCLRDGGTAECDRIRGPGADRRSQCLQKTEGA